MAAHVNAIRISVVGPCAAGKSTLTHKLRSLGYEVRMPAQEHSGVADMWQQLTSPDVLVYLDAELGTISRRRRIHWGQDRLEGLKCRLRHAREHANLYISTDKLTPDQVLQRVQAYLVSVC